MTDTTLDWKLYETQIHEELRAKYPNAIVRHDVRIPGRKSETSRQIDILLEEQTPAGVVFTIVEAKCHARPIDVKQVEAFIGLLNDVAIGRGVMIAPNGYSKAALTRAHRDDVDVDLDVFTLEEFRAWQADWAIPYAGRNGIIMPAPFGWAVDFRKRERALAWLYRRGLTFEQAWQVPEAMYVKIWDRRPPVMTLEALLVKQAKDISRSFPDARISVTDFTQRSDVQTCLRRAEIPSYPCAELTGFAEFQNGILFIVLFTPLVVEHRNLRKLEYILQKSVPLSVQHLTNPQPAPDS